MIPFRSPFGNPLAYADRRHWSLDMGRFAVQRWCRNERSCPATVHPITFIIWRKARHPKR